jgi:hypothetical protein
MEAPDNVDADDGPEIGCNSANVANNLPGGSLPSMLDGLPGNSNFNFDDMPGMGDDGNGGENEGGANDDERRPRTIGSDGSGLSNFFRSRPRGADPIVVVEADEDTVLAPSFTSATLSYANYLFNADGGWLVEAGEKAEVVFEYQLIKTLPIKTVASSCIDPEMLNEYAMSFEDQLGLNENQVAALKKELAIIVDGAPMPFELQLADPVRVNELLGWSLNGEKTDFAQLLFEPKGACSEQSLPVIPTETVDYLKAQASNGFVAGSL